MWRKPWPRRELSLWGLKALKKEWVLMDYNTLVIHIFMQERREFYNLEDLWSEVPKTQIDSDRNPHAASTASPEPRSDADTDPESIHHD